MNDFNRSYDAPVTSAKMLLEGYFENRLIRDELFWGPSSQQFTP